MCRKIANISYAFVEDTMLFRSLSTSILGNRIMFVEMMVVYLINKARLNMY
jgi:hypothetical protein